MDSRRLQELRDVYTQLSHQSTGPDGSQAAVVPAPAPTLQQPETHESGRFVASSAQYPVGIANPAAAAAATAAAAAAAAAASMTNFASSTMYSSADSGQTGWSASSMGTGMAGVSTEAPAASAAATAAAAASAVTPSAAAAGANPSGTQALSVPGAPIPPAVLGFMSPNPSENSGLSQGLPPFTNGPLGDRYSLGHVAPAKAPPAADGGGGGARTMGSGEASSSPARLKREVSSMSASEEQDGGNAAAGGTGGRKKRKRSERNSFYPVSYFEWTEELMAKELPEKSSGSFAAAIFELGLKHSSPKVLMKLMPPKANTLTTEHIKSRLQKYRLHAHRSKDEFLEFFNLRLKDKFADFLTQEGWRSLSPDHGREGNHNHNHHDHDRQHQHHRHEESEYDSAGGGDGTGGTEGRGSTGPESGDTPAVKVDGQLVGDIRDLGARCVREQIHLQEILRQHISAQLKLQAEIHEHLTTAACAGAGASSRNGSSGDGSDFNDGPAAGAAAATAAIGGGAGLATAEATPPHQQHPPPPPPPPPPPAEAAGVEGLGVVQGASSALKSEAQCGAAPTE